MAEEMIQTNQAEIFGEVKKNWGWMLALGILMLILGTIGLGMTVFLTIVSVLFFGIILLVASGAQIVDAFKSKGWKSVVLHVFMAIAYLIGGIAMILDPISSGIWLTMLIAGMFIAVGSMRIVMAFQMRPVKRWGWVAFSGALSILLGVMVLYQWPASGLWVIGMFVAIEMIFQGLSLITIAFAAKSSAKGQSFETGTPMGAAPA